MILMHLLMQHIIITAVSHIQDFGDGPTSLSRAARVPTGDVGVSPKSGICDITHL
jgi:hypothetical protein